MCGNVSSRTYFHRTEFFVEAAIRHGCQDVHESPNEKAWFFILECMYACVCLCIYFENKGGLCVVCESVCIYMCLSALNEVSLMHMHRGIYVRVRARMYVCLCKQCTWKASILGLFGACRHAHAKSFRRHLCRERCFMHFFPRIVVNEHCQCGEE